MSKHTPGPWKLIANEVIAASGDVIADVVGGEGCRFVEDDQNVECLANANLIATAPDMLTALQDIRRIIHGRGLSVEKLGRCHAIAEAMILKATGE